jgi:hypothetical protein
LDICWKIACSIDVDLNAGQTKHHDDWCQPCSFKHFKIIALHSAIKK